jgi:hypothetical protein
MWLKWVYWAKTLTIVKISSVAWKKNIIQIRKTSSGSFSTGRTLLRG